MKRALASLLILMIVCIVSSCISFNKRPHRIYNRAVRSGKVFDAVIVPGVPLRDSSWGYVMKTRVLWSYILYKNGTAKNIIYSGGAVYSPYKEAFVMGQYAQQLGIPKEHIFYDTMARHSTENVFYSYHIAQEKGFKNVAIATDPVQLFFLRLFIFEHYGQRIYKLPYIQDSLAKYNHLNPRIDRELLREQNAESFIPLPRKESFPRRMWGTLGQDIDWSYHSVTEKH